jgi:hypothetical protein
MAGDGEVQRHIRGGESVDGGCYQHAMVYPAQDNMTADKPTWKRAACDCRPGLPRS